MYVTRLHRSHSIICVAAGIATLVSGCTGSAVTGSIQPDMQYPNRVNLHAVLALPSHSRTHMVAVTPEGECASWTANVNVTRSLNTAIENGLLGGMQDVTMLDSGAQRPALGERDVYVTARMTDENAIIMEVPSRHHEHETSQTALQRARYAVAFELHFMDAHGREIYVTKAMGSGIADYSGGCNGGIADCLKNAIESAYQKVCDFLAHEVYNSPQLARYAQEHGG